MLTHKLFSPKVPPEFLSSAWIAHNAAMKAKAPLLGRGYRPVVCGAYEPPPAIRTAAMHIRRKTRIPFMEKVRSVLCMIGFVTVMAFIASLGHAVGFY